VWYVGSPDINLKDYQKYLRWWSVDSDINFEDDRKYFRLRKSSLYICLEEGVNGKAKIG